MKPRCFVAAYVLVLLSSAHGKAQNATNAALAEALFKEARTLMNQERYDDACPKLEESERLDPAAGTLLNLARCYENQGKVASAWATYQEALVLARRQDNAQRVQVAAERHAALQSQLPYLTIELAADAELPALEVKLDGRLVARPSLGVKLPVDPGRHIIVTSSPGYVAQEETLEFKPREQQTVTLRKLTPRTPELPHAATLASTKSDASPNRDASTSRTMSSPNQASITPKDRNLAVPIALAGFSAAMLAIGTYAGFYAIKRMDDSDRGCPHNACSIAGARASRIANRSANIANVTLPLGVVAGGLSTWLFLRPARPSNVDSANALSFDLDVSPSSLGAFVQRSF